MFRSMILCSLACLLGSGTLLHASSLGLSAGATGLTTPQVMRTAPAYRPDNVGMLEAGVEGLSLTAFNGGGASNAFGVRSGEVPEYSVARSAFVGTNFDTFRSVRGFSRRDSKYPVEQWCHPDPPPAPTPAPESSSAVLFGLGLLGIGGWALRANNLGRACS